MLVYLTADEAVRLLGAISELSAPGSQLAVEHSTTADAGLVARACAMPSMNRFTSLWKGGLGDETPGWLTGNGWQIEVHDRATVAASYGRPAPGPSPGGFVVATRRPRPR